MTGAEHYALAEELIKKDMLETPENNIVARQANIIALAQVHATLALAAANTKYPTKYGQR